ncbi:MAG: hypothetical protein ACK5O2_09925 [Microthrixaceae bacterium]
MPREDRNLRSSKRIPLVLAVLGAIAILALGCIPTPDGGGTEPSGIELVETRVVSYNGLSVTAELYRNNDLDCGRQGKFTFVVIAPDNDVAAEAPLWVFLHGGGVGYFEPDEDPSDGVNPEYVGGESMNDEESLTDLVKRVYSNGDTIMMRRLAEGWRILVPSLCDHDMHSGEGNDYPNNPYYGTAGDTVDGLDANVAALEFVAELRPTTWVVVHGTSAGSVGAFALAQRMHEEGIDLNAAILDAYLITPRLLTIFAAGYTPQQQMDPDFSYQAVVDKVGRFVDVEGADGIYPTKAVEVDDFRAVPLLDVVGTADPHCSGDVAPVPGVPAGMGNCEYVHQGFADAIAAQDDSPHAAILVEGAGHVPTKNPNLVNLADDVDNWLNGVIAADPGHYPFG